MRKGRSGPAPTVSEIGAPVSTTSPPSDSQIETNSVVCLDRAGFSAAATNIHVSQSHTNLLLMDTRPETSELVGGEKSQPLRKLNFSVLLEPSLMALLSDVSCYPLSLADSQLQAIKAVLDNYCSKYTGEWDKILGESANSLFHALGGWRALILKLHQAAASLVLPTKGISSLRWSNAWETTALLSHISRIKVNPGRVQDCLRQVLDVEEKIPVIAINLQDSAIAETGAKIVASVDLQVLWYSVQCCGRFDVYLEALLASQMEALGANFSESLGHSWELSKSIAEKGIEIYKSSQFRHRLFSEQYDWYLLMLSQQGSQEGVEATMRDIETDIWYSNFNPCDFSARKRIERLLVQMIGHSSESIRSSAVKLMNRFYDCHDWQKEFPFENIQILTVGDDIEVDIPEIAAQLLQTVAFEIVAPSMSPEHHQHESLCRFVVEGAREVVRFTDVSACGFYDWRLVRLTPTGWRSIKDPLTSRPIMGRVIVHPRAARGLHLVSALVDEVGGEIDLNSGFFTTRGNFGTVSSSLDELSDIGFNAVHLQGVLARDSGRVETDSQTGEIKAERPHASPWAVTDRASPCELLGGKSFSEVTSTARRKGIHTIVDAVAQLSSTRKHRKYKDQMLFYVDTAGVKRLMYATGTGETCMLNYRMVEAWELLVSDISEWPAQYGTSGCWLDSAAHWPRLMEPDLAEMLRVDADGEPHYSNAEILTGVVVRESLDGQTGFWRTTAREQGYANPILCKIVREVWRKFPNFYFFSNAETPDQSSSLARSGVIPVATGLAAAAARLVGNRLDTATGHVEGSTACATVEVLQEYLTEISKTLPNGAVAGLSSVFKESPLPAGLLDRGRAAFTDLIMAAPFLPCLRYGEYDCIRDRSDIRDRFRGARSDASSTPPLPGSPWMTTIPPLAETPFLLHSVAPLMPRRSSVAAVLTERAIQGIDVGEFPVELDPANAIAQYSRWAKTRRKRSHLFTAGSFKVLQTNDPQVLAFVREFVDTFTGRLIALVACLNFGPNDSVVEVQLSLAATGRHEFLIETDLAGSKSSLTTPWSASELDSCKLKLVVPRFGSIFRLFKSVKQTVPNKKFLSDLLSASLRRKGAYIKTRVVAAVADSTCESLHNLLDSLVAGGVAPDASLLSQLVFVGSLDDDQKSLLMAKLTVLSDAKDGSASAIVASWNMGPILFTTPELGKWSTFGGLGVMVDDLINTLSPIMGSSSIHPLVWVCSPYYERNRKGESGYLARDSITWSFNIEVDIGIDRVTVGVFESVINNVRHLFLHHGKYFPSIYPDFTPVMMTAFLALMAKCPLEICCKLGVIPSTIVTNDWATGLTAAYAKNGFFGSVFSGSKFLHIVHNLDQNYEGRIFPQRHEDVGKIHMLPTDLLVDPHWQRLCVNPSRCAILASDNWGTVSVSYRKELMEGSPLSPVLRLHAHPFAHPNGIPLQTRLDRIRATGFGSHPDAKAALQRKYFGGQPNENTVLVAFVGRITFQKGVHLILDIAEQVLKRHSGNVQILIGGAANPGEQYAAHCAHRMRDLTRRYPSNFWSDPDSFFVDGPLVNLGADFGLMPSAFEPGGIVQQEFMVAGTPVIAFKTGGLRDTISEFFKGEGNGFTFEAHTCGDLAYATERALRLYWGDKPGYERLRDNARKSVVTCDMVARAWLKEIYRMHGKVYVDHSRVEDLAKGHPSWMPRDEIPAMLESEPESVDLTNDEVSDREGSHSQVSSPKSVASKTMLKDPSIASIVRRSVRVSFKPKLSVDVPRSVLLAGSFDQWASRIPLRWNKQTRMFYVDIRVPQGKWQIKLIVDGLWTCIDDYPTEKDWDGNLNNVILVD